MSIISSTNLPFLRDFDLEVNRENRGEEEILFLSSKRFCIIKTFSTPNKREKKR